MTRKKGYKYPRLTILVIVLVLTVFAFAYESTLITSVISSLGLVGVFLTGFMYTFSFTAFAATGILLTLGEGGNILFLGILAGLGSVMADLLILKIARVSFESEFKYLYKEPFLKALIKPIPKPFQHFLKVVIAMVIIASPLPDEAGVTLLANGYTLPKPIFSLMSFILNTTGILVILYTGQAL